jgi:hypothetical protein
LSEDGGRANAMALAYKADLLGCGLAAATIARGLTALRSMAAWTRRPIPLMPTVRSIHRTRQNPGVQFLRATVQRLAQGSVPMGLESRGGKFYYYRKVWDRGRVKSEYVAGGLLALLAARMEQEDREQKEARKAAEQARWDEEREQIDAVDSQIDAYLRSVEGAVNAALESAGYHRPSRRLRWAKRRRVTS